MPRRRWNRVSSNKTTRSCSDDMIRGVPQRGLRSHHRRYQLSFSVHTRASFETRKTHLNSFSEPEDVCGERQDERIDGMRRWAYGRSLGLGTQWVVGGQPSTLWRMDRSS